MELILAQVTGLGALEQMPWLEVLGLLIVPGVFGGILSVLQLIDVPRLMNHEKHVVIVSRRRFGAAMGLGAFGGAGGAFAILLAGLWTHQLDDNLTDSARNRLVLCSLGVVSGFVGFRLLKSVASNLEKQIRDVELRTEERVREMERRIIEDDNTLERARVAFRNNSAPLAELKEAITQLEQVRTRRSADRVVGIVLGNLYDRIGEHDRAVAVVTDVLAAKGRIGTAADKDASDLLFNRACYRIPTWKKADTPQKKEVIKKQILDDLKTCFTYFPGNKIIAQGDDDLAHLNGDAEFEALVRS